ncbi:MAG: type I restriction endonuclease subunit R, partial [Polyangiaceae bacterium]|nr:type I restriction endonuclease subunit R [Polyangiaceae bacterium]
HFILFETDGSTLIKKVAGYHQFHAANKAVRETVRATQPNGDSRIGVVWHTQGSGKSISMCFYAGKIILSPAMQNPTLVVLTDRNDLDGQLFAQFSRAKDLIPVPQQAESREHLRELLQVASGGVYFTTIQKFGLGDDERATGADFPELSTRHNIVVIADEAHRSQYGHKTRFVGKNADVARGLAANMRKALPNAAFIGFTGTPIEFEDKSTPALFGEYIDTYRISQAVEDGATVPLHYEARLAKIHLDGEAKDALDDDFDDVTEGEEDVAKDKLKSKWARLEAVVGSPERIQLIAKDLLDHWDRRTEILAGKAMVVVMSRRIAVDLYDALVSLRPEWASDDDTQGALKVVMTGAAGDPATFHKHIRKRAGLKSIEKRFKDPDDSLQMVIVRDMWLTGFDAPAAHTLYLDKPMQGHGLMQTIARVNRVFKDKPAGLIVDYLGLAEQLRKAVKDYDGKEERPTEDVSLKALPILREAFGVVRDLFHGFDYSGFRSPKASARIEALAGGVNHILEGLDDGTKRFGDQMVKLNKAAGLCLHLEEARSMADEVGYFQTVHAAVRKNTVGGSGKSLEHMETAIRQILANAVTGDEVIDIFGAAGLKKPDLSILSDEFLESIKDTPYKNLQLELLRKLLNDEIKALGKRNVVQSKKFSEMLEKTLNQYQNRSLTSAEIIQQLIQMAKDMREARERGNTLGLTEDELAFYDALADHGDVKNLMGDTILAGIAMDLVKEIRRSVTIDWTQKGSVRAKMRTRVKRLLRRHGYPPDKQEAAIEMVISQAERVCKDWAEAA